MFKLKNGILLFFLVQWNKRQAYMQVCLIKLNYEPSMKKIDAINSITQMISVYWNSLSNHDIKISLENTKNQIEIKKLTSWICIRGVNSNDLRKGTNRSKWDFEAKLKIKGEKINNKNFYNRYKEKKRMTLFHKSVWAVTVKGSPSATSGLWFGSTSGIWSCWTKLSADIQLGLIFGLTSSQFMSEKSALTLGYCRN